MDRNLHTDDFESLLREKSDEFRMYPSKRIWHSIYNNIHPGKKWPSVAMSIVLITGLFLVGYLNTDSTQVGSSASSTRSQSATTAQARIVQPSSAVITAPLETAPVIITSQEAPVASAARFLPGANSANAGAVSSKIASSRDELAAAIPAPDNDGTTSRASHTFAITVNPPESELMKSTGGVNPAVAVAAESALNALPEILTTDADIKGEHIPAEPFTTTVNKAAAGLSINGDNADVASIKKAASTRDYISLEDKEWIDNYALYNRPAAKKWANKLAWQLYATPSIIYRSLYNDPNFGNPVNPAPMALSVSSQDVNKFVNQRPSLGFEVGTGFQYAVSRILKLKAGLQLNYTRYNADAFQNTHPFTTKLMMHDYRLNTSFEELRSTPYSNKSGLEAIKLHNETFQVSLPMGADLKLIGNSNIQWNIGLTIQPTYVPSGKSYLVSSDRRNYVKETSMLNRWNLNAGFETFISYKSANGLVFQVGPQFRSQLFSTNTRRVAVEEKLLSYGLKFGIAKNIK